MGLCLEENRRIQIRHNISRGFILEIHIFWALSKATVAITILVVCLSVLILNQNKTNYEPL